jgi:hypothetical protein
MPAATLAAVSPLQVVFCRKNQQPLFVQVIILAFFQCHTQSVYFFLNIKYPEFNSIRQKYLLRAARSTAYTL